MTQCADTSGVHRYASMEKQGDLYLIANPTYWSRIRKAASSKRYETDFVLCDMVLLPSPSKSVDSREWQSNAWVVSVHEGDYELLKLKLTLL